MGHLEIFFCLAESGMEYYYLQKQKGKMRGCTGATEADIGNVLWQQAWRREEDGKETTGII